MARAQPFRAMNDEARIGASSCELGSPGRDAYVVIPGSAAIADRCQLRLASRPMAAIPAMTLLRLIPVSYTHLTLPTKRIV